MSRGCAAALLALAGCLSVPAYAPEVAVTYTESGTGGTAAGPGFALHFADGNGFHFPDALLIDGNDVLGHATAPGCADEDEAGIAVSPTMRISAHGGASPVMNQLVAALRGPAVVQVRLDWATRFACNLDRTPRGTATFTVFPDGRIVRHDIVADPATSPLLPADCSCGGDMGTQFTITAFWTLARSRFMQIYAPDARAFPDPSEVITNMSTSCIDSTGYQVAFGWRETDGMTILSGDSVIGFGRDLTQFAQSLSQFSFKNRSALFIGRTGCGAGVARALEYAAPSCRPDSSLACLSINGTGTTPAEVDGIYGGDTGTGMPGLDVGMGATELKGSLKSAFAVWLRFPRAVSAVRATLQGAQGAWYVPQQVDDRSWILWFRDSLSASQMITVEPI